MKKRFVLPYKGRMDLIEGLRAPIKFALLDDEWRQLHTPVMCKDYIQDAFWSEHNKTPIQIYGFAWSPGTINVNKTAVDLELIINDKSAHSNTENIVTLLHAWEERLGFKTCSMTNAGPSSFVLTLDSQWFKQPIRVSLLTFLIRIGQSYNGEPMSQFLDSVRLKRAKLFYSGDAYYATSARKRLELIFTSGKFPSQTYKQFKGDHDIHDRSGIVGYHD